MLVIDIALGILLALGVLRVIGFFLGASAIDDRPKVSKAVWIALALTPLVCIGFMLIH